jgi:hypothetical protein
VSARSGARHRRTRGPSRRATTAVTGAAGVIALVAAGLGTDAISRPRLPGSESPGTPRSGETNALPLYVDAGSPSPSAAGTGAGGGEADAGHVHAAGPLGSTERDAAGVGSGGRHARPGKHRLGSGNPAAAVMGPGQTPDGGSPSSSPGGGAPGGGAPGGGSPTATPTRAPNPGLPVPLPTLPVPVPSVPVPLPTSSLPLPLP